MKQFLKILQNSGWMLEEIIFFSKLALPPSIVYLTEGLQMKISNVFIGRNSGGNIENMLSALFLGQVVVSMTSYALTEGLSIYINILCSQAYGAKQYKLVGLYFYRALFMAALTFFPLSSLFISIRPIVYSITQDWELAYHAGSYTSVLCIGYPGYAYFKTSLRFLQAQNIVWPPLLYIILGNILNGILQYVLICHYHAGIAGAAAGYVISLYFIALLLFAHIKLTRVHIVTSTNWTCAMIDEWFHSASYTFFPMIQNLASNSSSSLVPLILLGFIFDDTSQLAIYTIQISLWVVFALWAMGFSSAITVRIGNLLGAYEYKRAFRAAMFSIVYGETIALILTALLFFLSGPFSHLFTTDFDFAQKLSFNIKGMCFIVLCDHQIFTQGILNGCCMQGTQALVKFVSRTVLGITLGIIITSLVEWKALGIFLANGIACTVAFVIGMAIILTRNWKDVALNVSKNTTSIHKEGKLKEKHRFCSRITRKLCRSTIWESKIFIKCRYCILILLGGCLFFGVALCQS